MTIQDGDIALTDAYSRSKRASLLYSAILIVLVAAAYSANNENVEWLGTHIPFRLAEILFWFPAAYYTLNFWLEWRFAKIRNSKAISNKGASNVNDSLEALQQKFLNFTSELDGMSERFKKALKSATGYLDGLEKATGAEAQTLAEDLFRRVDKGFIHPPAGEGPDVRPYTTAEIANAIQVFERQANHVVGTVRTSLAAQKDDSHRGFEELTKFCSEINASLKELASDFRRLSSRFNREQKFMFYAVDLWTVLGLFLFSTLLVGASLWGLLDAGHITVRYV